MVLHDVIILQLMCKYQRAHAFQICISTKENSATRLKNILCNKYEIRIAIGTSSSTHYIDIYFH